MVNWIGIGIKYCLESRAANTHFWCEIPTFGLCFMNPLPPDKSLKHCERYLRDLWRTRFIKKKSSSKTKISKLQNELN